MRYFCQTLFDITATGVTGHYKPTRVPFRDRTGALVTDEDSWDRARNQQRNWETLTQILALRTQITELTDPIRHNNSWQFEFATDRTGVFGPDTDPTQILREDAQGVPMLLGATTGEHIVETLETQGDEQNIWFYPMTNTATK